MYKCLAYEYDRITQIFILGKEDIGKIWRGNAENKKVGEEGNDTVTHSASKSEHVEWSMKNTIKRFEFRDDVINTLNLSGFGYIMFSCDFLFRMASSS